LGADVTRLSQLNNPDAKIPNTLLIQLGKLIAKLKDFNTEEEAKKIWNSNVVNIINNLLPIEQEIDIEEHQRRYIAVFEKFFTLTQRLKTCKNIEQMSDLILTTLNDIDAFDNKKAKAIYNLILTSIYEENSSQLKE